MHTQHPAFFRLLIGIIVYGFVAPEVQAKPIEKTNSSKESISNCRELVWLQSESQSASELKGISEFSLLIDDRPLPQPSGIDVRRLIEVVTRKCVEKGITVSTDGDDSRKLPVLVLSIVPMSNCVKEKESVNILRLRLLEVKLLARDMKTRDLSPSFQYESLLSVGRVTKLDSAEAEKKILDAVDFFLLQWKLQNKP